MVLDGIVRVSKVGGRSGESFISPEVQEEQINAWGRLRNVEIAMQERELDRTGTNLDRPVVNRSLERIERGETDGIVVARVDRLSRAGVGEALRLVERIDELGGRLAVIDIGADPTTIFGEFAITLFLGLARMQARQIGENWHTARKAAVDRGVFVGGFVPPGYLKGDDGRLVVDVEIAEGTIRGFFSRRASRESWSRCAAWLGEQIGREVSVETARNLIATRTYLGEVHGGPDLVNRTAHPALVDRPLFEAANAVVGVVPARSGNATSVLSGLIRCAGCRYAMKATMNRSRHGKPFLEMRCKSKDCGARTSASAGPLEDLVLRRFFERIGDYRLWQVEGSRELEDAEARLLAAESELDAALDTRLADALGAAGSDRYLELVRTRRASVDAAATAVASARSAQIAFPEAELAEMWPDLPLHDRRRLLAATLDAVFVRRGADLGERLHFCWHGEAPELPTPGRRWSPTPFDFPA
jgi:site-specific DNA recombinase